jgi:hypothetical protein
MASNETGSAGNTIRRHMSTLDSGHDRTAEETDKNCIGSLKQKTTSEHALGDPNPSVSRE